MNIQIKELVDDKATSVSSFHSAREYCERSASGVWDVGVAAGNLTDNFKQMRKRELK